MSVANEKNNLLYIYINNFTKIVVIKPPGFRKLGHSSDMQNDVLWGFKGLENYWSMSGQFILENGVYDNPPPPPLPPPLTAPPLDTPLHSDITKQLEKLVHSVFFFAGDSFLIYMILRIKMWYNYYLICETTLRSQWYKCDINLTLHNIFRWYHIASQ